VTKQEIKRDRWDRPLILPLGGEGEPTAYTRVSKLAKALDDQQFLMLWKQRKTLEGVIRRPDLLTRAAGVLAKGDPDTDYLTKKALNAICGEATTAAGADRGSSAGTGFHDLTEVIDRGEEPLFVPPADQPRLDAYRYATKDLIPLDIETFIVNDIVRCAGTFDRLVLCPDGKVRVADLKSGKSEALYPLATAIQIAIYANGKRYNPETGERTDLHPDLDLTTGLLLHMPPSGGCEVVPLNIELGWKAALLADKIHHHVRKWKPKDLIREGTYFFDSDATLTQGESEEVTG
jgi:hypothetical protein